MFLTILAFAVLLGYGAFQQGAMPVLDGMVVSAGVAVLAVVYFLLKAREAAPPATNWILGVALWIAALLCFQLAPLPPWILRTLSPYSGQVAAALDPGGWFPITLTPAHSRIWLFRLSASLLAMLVARDLAWRSGRVWPSIFPVLFVAGGESVLGLVQAFSGGPEASARGTYPNRDHFSGLMEMGIPLAVMAGVAWYQGGRRRFETSAAGALGACGFFALAVSMLVAVLLSLSRMGFLTALASLLFVGAISSSVAFSDRIGPRLLWLPVAVVGAVVFLAFIYLPTDQLIDRFAGLGRQELSADTRTQIWKDSLGIAAKAPLFGCGVGSYMSAFLAFKHVAPMNSVAYSHNDYIQVMAEFGVLGAVPIALLIGLAMKGGLDSASLSRDNPRHYLGIGCAGSLFALLLHGLVDFNLYIPANNLAFFWIAGVALGVGAFRYERLPAHRAAPVREFARR